MAHPKEFEQKWILLNPKDQTHLVNVITGGKISQSPGLKLEIIDLLALKGLANEIISRFQQLDLAHTGLRRNDSLPKIVAINKKGSTPRQAFILPAVMVHYIPQLVLPNEQGIWGGIAFSKFAGCEMEMYIKGRNLLVEETNKRLMDKSTPPLPKVLDSKVMAYSRDNSLQNLVRSFGYEARA